MSSYCEVCQHLFCGSHEHCIGISNNDEMLNKNKNNNVNYNNNNINNNNNVTILKSEEDKTNIWQEREECLESQQEYKKSELVSNVNTQHRDIVKSKKCVKLHTTRNNDVLLTEQANVLTHSPSPSPHKVILLPSPELLLREHDNIIDEEEKLEEEREQTTTSTLSVEYKEENDVDSAGITAVVQRLRSALHKHRRKSKAQLNEQSETDIEQNVSDEGIIAQNIESSISSHNKTYLCNSSNSNENNNNVNDGGATRASNNSVSDDNSNNNISTTDKQRTNDEYQHKKNGSNNKFKTKNNEIKNVMKSAVNTSFGKQIDGETLWQMLKAREHSFEQNMSEEMQSLREAFVHLCQAVKEDIDALGNASMPHSNAPTPFIEEQQKEERQIEHCNSKTHSTIYDEEYKCIHDDKYHEYSNNYTAVNGAEIAHLQGEEKISLLKLLEQTNEEDKCKIAAILFPCIVKLLIRRKNEEFQEYISSMLKNTLLSQLREIKMEKQNPLEDKAESNVIESTINREAMIKLKQQIKEELLIELTENGLIISNSNEKNNVTISAVADTACNVTTTTSSLSDASEINKYTSHSNNDKCINVGTANQSSLVIPLEPSFKHHIPINEIYNNTAHVNKNRSEKTCNTAINTLTSNNNNALTRPMVQIEDVLSVEALEAHVRIAVQSVLRDVELYQQQQQQQQQQLLHRNKENTRTQFAKDPLRAVCDVKSITEHVKKDVKAYIDAQLR